MFGSKKKTIKAETLVRRGDFMTKPEKGWLHNGTLLTHGKGVYYCFPVRYVGSLQVLTSLNPLSLEEKTALCREAIDRCLETAKLRKKSKRKVPKHFKEYIAEAPYVKVLDIKINISSEGIATSDLQQDNVLSNDPIGKISFATGGEKEAYSIITYVAKDKKENRYCHVFDCGALADDVLATLGQVFTLTSAPKEPAPLRGTAALEAASRNQSSAGPAMNPMYFEHGPAPPPTRPRPAAKPADASPIYDNRQRRTSEMSESSGGGDVYGDDEAPTNFAARRPSTTSKSSSQPIYAQGDAGYLDNSEILYEDGSQGPGGKDPGAQAAPKPPAPRAMAQPVYGDDEAAGYLADPQIYADGDAGYLANPGGDAGYLGAGEMYDVMGDKSADEVVRIANEKFQSSNIYGDDPDRGEIYGDGKVGWSYLKVQGVERSLADMALG